jgi:methylmalonyl-CoA/ethylmalonyl-CoA epimerase
MSATVKSDNPNIIGLKHMAFAVRDAEAARATYARFLCVPEDAPVHEYAKSRNRVVLFDLGGIEYQLCQSMDADGRFATWIDQRGAEGLHHICYAVDDIDKALAHAQANGASLRECKSCKKFGSHVHPEGWVAFLDNDAGGIEIEFMQVYTPEQLEQYKSVQGI